MAWFERDLTILRYGTTAEGKPKVSVRKEAQFAEPWRAGPEYVVVQAKVRPALVISREREHELRDLVSLVPIYRVGEGGFFETHKDEIRARLVPGVLWLERLRLDNVIEPRVVDCTAMVSVPRGLLNGRTRIGVLDRVTFWAILEYWSESVVAPDA